MEAPPVHRPRLIFFLAMLWQRAGIVLFAQQLSVGITSSNDRSLINGGLQVWSFLVAIFFSRFVDKNERLLLFLIAAVGMLLTFTIWTAYSAIYAQTETTLAGSAVIAMIFFSSTARQPLPGLVWSDYCILC